MNVAFDLVLLGNRIHAEWICMLDGIHMPR